MSTDSLLRLSQDLQAVALVSENYKAIKRRKRRASDLVGLGLTNIIGTTLVREQANI